MVLTDYDIVSEAGGPNIANVQQFDVTPTSGGQITVSLSPGDVDGPIIQGVELVGGGGSVVASGQYVISGHVTLGGTGPAVGSGVAGTTLTLSGSQSAVTTSAADGSYSFIVNAGGTYTVTLATDRYYYYTAPVTVSNISANQPNVNFTALLLAGSSFAPTSPHIEYIYMNGALVVVEHPH